MGTGRGAKENDDTNLMYMLRTQWNFLGSPLKFSGSDIEYHEKGTGLLALAAVTNRSPYTSFSQAVGENYRDLKSVRPVSIVLIKACLKPLSNFVVFPGSRSYTGKKSMIIK